MTGQDLAKARKAAGINQRDLADALALKGGRGTLTDIENGTVNPTDAWILYALGVLGGMCARKDNAAA